MLYALQYPYNTDQAFYNVHADVLLVSLLDRKVFNMTIPGKIQFYLSSGIPIIGMICGEGAQIIKESNGGFVCNSGDYIALSRIISKLINLDKNKLKEIGMNGKKYSKKEFSKSTLVKSLNEILINTVNNYKTKKIEKRTNK